MRTLYTFGFVGVGLTGELRAGRVVSPLEKKTSVDPAMLAIAAVYLLRMEHRFMAPLVDLLQQASSGPRGARAFH
jgi:hypothetical protein